MSKGKKIKDIIVVGFALFAIFFGAANLIFPPYIGVVAGKKWYEVMWGFLMTDPLLPVIGVIVTAKMGGRADVIGERVSPVFSKIVGAVCMLIIGPLFAVPRTSATTHDIAVKQLFPEAPIIVTSLVFFGLTVFFVLNEGKVIDKIGKYLTPGLLIVLVIMIIATVFNPLGEMKEMPDDNFFLKGFTEGYQTMDALGSALLAGIIMADIKRRGYKDKKEQMHMIIGVGIVTFILLAFVYGGLTYVGATAGEHFTADTPRTDILVGVVDGIFGNTGKICMGIIVSLACLTTSVGLSATCGNYFESISGGKLSYKFVALVSIGISFVLSLLGVENLIYFAVPVLMITYPVLIVLMLMTAFDHKIKYNLTYTGAVVGTLAISIVQSMNGFFGIWPVLGERVNALPLSSIGLGWFVPATICAFLFTAAAVFMEKGKAGGK